MSHVIRWDKSKYLGACRNAANASRNFLAFAGMLQAARKTFWPLQERCKRLEKLFGLCRNAANASKNFLAFAGMLQTPRKTFRLLQERCKHFRKTKDRDMTSRPPTRRMRSGVTRHEGKNVRSDGGVICNLSPRAWTQPRRATDGVSGLRRRCAASSLGCGEW